MASVRYISAKSAAQILNCDPKHVSYLCSSGKLKARKKPTQPGDPGYNRWGYVWEVSKNSVDVYLKIENTRGRPRGSGSK